MAERTKDDKKYARQYRDLVITFQSRVELWTP